MKFSLEVDVVKGTVVCGPGDGHVRGREDDKLGWDSREYNFTLQFALLTGSGDPDWPFKEPRRPPSKVRHFGGTLALPDPADPPAYKYTVTVDGYVPLDPIIIVDKK